ncbi:MAG TPA: hypothetical protein VK498_15745 [Ferruginibacter sp.]|nr:hypothetical protein [Ferruginibacter sp.]
MDSKQLTKSFFLVIILVVCFLVSWEGYWRSQGYGITYNDDKNLWASTRKLANGPVNKTTVFIGSSRIKFDLDIPTWEKQTATKAVQLAIGGSSPLPSLENLAEDEHFKGNLIVDVTEGLFFSLPGSSEEKWAQLSIDQFTKGTPAQKTSFVINKGLESKLVFLEESMFALTPLLEDMQIQNRPGVFTFPIFPKKFETNDLARQSRIPKVFMLDTALQRIVKNIWIIFRMTDTTYKMRSDTIQMILARVKKATDKISARGGRILFVRTPSSGDVWKAEEYVFKRSEYWDKLLAYTGLPGIHFNDYPSINNFMCPEWSHLSQRDAVKFTKGFIDIFERSGWSHFNKAAL